MDKALQEFIEFAKDRFGVDVAVSESDKPDSFESLFGGSFPLEDNQVTLMTSQPEMMPIVLPPINASKIK